LKRAAASVGVPIAGLWLDVRAPVAARRLRTRVRDASDATVDVLLAQMMRSTGPIAWTRIDASRPVEKVEEAAREILDLPKRSRSSADDSVGGFSGKVPVTA
jgi:predicted kinase